MRRVALSYWTVCLIGLALFGVHAWFWSSYPAHRAEVISGFGAALIVLGLWVAARPFIRSGLAVMVGQAMPPLQGAFLDGDLRGHQRREAMRPQVRRDVIAERIIAVLVIAVGTLLNGYAAPLVRVSGF